jgi:1,2-phenylacetyl-CoA epoxidase catalytic subunit
MKPNEAQTLAKAIDAITQRMDSMDAHRMADGLLLVELILAQPEDIRAAFMKSARELLTELPLTNKPGLATTQAQRETAQQVREFLNALPEALPGPPSA